MGASASAPASNGSAENKNNDDHPDNKAATGDDLVNMKDRPRHCTDCICLLLLIAAWVVMSIIGLIVTGAISNPNLSPGDPARLTNAMDYRGRTCGVTDSVKTRPSGYYLPSGTVVCVSSCPSTTDYTQFICQDEVQDASNINVVTAWTNVANYKCMFAAKTIKVANRCIYQSQNTNQTAGAIAKQFIGAAVANTVPASYSSDSDNDYYTQLFGDIWKLKGYIFGFGIGIAVVFSFLYLYVLRIPCCLKIFIWAIVFSILVGFLIGSILLYSLGQSWKSSGSKTTTEVNLMLGMSYVGFACTFLYFCLIIILCKRIMLAIGIVLEASKSITSMPLLILMPIIQVTGCVAFLIPWTIFVAYLASSGDVTTITKSYNGISYSYREVSYSKNTKYAFLYYLFCWFWTSEFIIATGQLIIALAVATWYFTKDKSTVGNSTFFWAFRTTLRYHLGTAAHGSLIIAIIKTIRAVVAYLQKKAKDSHNTIMQAVLCCVQCCLWCFEKCMKFINKNAYIQTAIYGYGFCHSARVAFFLILRNILRVAAVGIVSEIVLILGKLFVPILTTLACYLCVGYGLPQGETNGIVVPMAMVFVLSYFVASMFTEIFGMAIETILCCYIADEESFPPEERFADGDLKSSVQKHAEQAAKNQQNVQVQEVKVAPKDDKGEPMM